MLDGIDELLRLDEFWNSAFGEVTSKFITNRKETSISCKLFKGTINFAFIQFFFGKK